jgi:hypothetical protein
MNPPHELPDWNQDERPRWWERTQFMGTSLAAVLLAAALMRVLGALWR